MAEIVYDPSCEVAAAQLEPLAESHRLTVICGLYAPESDEIALVRSIKAIDQETHDEALKLAQGGIDPGESIGDAFERELVEELALSLDAIQKVYGLPMPGGAKTGGRRGRGRGRQAKAFGVLCGVVEGRPELTPNPQELISGAWYSIAEAEEAFAVQLAHPYLHARGERSMRVLDAIRGIDLSR